MGFPYETADWAVVDGPMFMGWGGSAPGWYTAIAILACIVVLWAGASWEDRRYDK